MEDVLKIVLPIIVGGIPLGLIIAQIIKNLKWKKVAGHRVKVHKGQMPALMAPVLMTIDAFLEAKFPDHPELKDYFVEIIENDQLVRTPTAPQGLDRQGREIGASLKLTRLWFFTKPHQTAIMRRGLHDLHYAFLTSHEIVAHDVGVKVYNDPNYNHDNKKLMALLAELDARLLLLKEEIH